MDDPFLTHGLVIYLTLISPVEFVSPKLAFMNAVNHFSLGTRSDQSSAPVPGRSALEGKKNSPSSLTLKLIQNSAVDASARTYSANATFYGLQLVTRDAAVPDTKIEGEEGLSWLLSV